MNNAWWYFWTICFVVAGASFFVMALMVLVRGAGDLRRMIRYIASRHGSGSLLLLFFLALVAKGDDIVRVGAVQMNARRLDKQFNLAQAEEGIRHAAARGAQIVCTPEVAVQGYPRVEFPVGSHEDDPALVAERARILAAAEPIPGPATDRFAHLARELGIWIIFGIDENRGGRLFDSAVLISPAGKIEGVYSKVHLQNWMTASGVNNGSDFPVWDISVGNIRLKTGIQICYDIQHPESTRELAIGGAEVVFVPYCTNDFSRPLLVHLFQTRALENRVYIVRVNYGAPRKSGTSSIIDFEGSTQDELDNAPSMLVGDLNLTALRKARADWDEVYGLRYRQPAAYKRIARGLELRDFAPIDAHTHIFVDDPHFHGVLNKLDAHIVNVTVVDPYERGYEKLEPQERAVQAVARGAKGRAPWVATFDPSDFESTGFSARVIGHLDEEFRQGAVGVKIYKTIGMLLRRQDGHYVMPDDPVFRPILDAIADRGKTLYAHIAEPIGAWKPLDPSDPDSDYYQQIPQWHMYGHPDRPSKATILAARDRMLAQHPNLRVVGCHLGSMEENVDDVARRLDAYPNFAVDTAARVTHLALQPREKVRAFLIRYQDRLLYGTDFVLMPWNDAAAKAKSWEAELQRDWKYFATSEQVQYMGRTVTGLALPESVLRKLYHANATRWVPGIAEQPDAVAGVSRPSIRRFR